MKITTQQAAELLNCHPSNLTRLVRDGKLKNLAIPRPGAERANGKFELTEVAELAKTYIARKGRPREKKEKSGKNGKSDIVVSRTLDVLLERTKQIDGRLSSIEFALISLDTKLEKLVKSWT